MLMQPVLPALVGPVLDHWRVISSNPVAESEILKRTVASGCTAERYKDGGDGSDQEDNSAVFVCLQKPQVYLVTAWWGPDPEVGNLLRRFSWSRRRVQFVSSYLPVSR